ncbi:FAD-binding monooxygenase [Actinomycetospora sp. NBRC 106375]|uniref:FAD-dependent monooxygenase n=1 Tax=Actinomycetospora sp. NBRC 106375 TaxID=3032207 RepID=UPI0024A2F53D|nr:FAD-dependent monooxygenase [Actinomycetospora sp. NBRC 106375]GLZ46518.1 FAD-binding monooxygenase [Actinomycetospora sp. NBRC 106375]
MTRHALISGASIAGPALAHQLAARGWRTTVVERAPQRRDEGQNIDVRGAGREALRRMGLEEAVLAAGTGEVGLRFVDDDGAAVAEFPAGENDTAGGTAEMEVLRGELSRILLERTAEATDYRFGTQIRDLADHGDHVTATLSDGEVVDADLVVVAEGTRSRTRDLVLPDAEVRDVGLQVAYLTIPRTPDDDRWWRWHSAPGSRSTSLRPDNLGTTRAMLAFLTDVRGLGELDRDAHVTVLRRTYADVGWQAPRVLAALDDAPMYFDAVAQIRLPRWSAGRTVLLGDAAWATGPFGLGTSLALVGAYVLAGELDAQRDVGAALARYEERMRPFVAEAQDVKPAALRAMNPRSSTGLAVQRTVLGAVGSLASVFGGLVEKLTGPPSEAIELPDYPAPAPLAAT